MTTFFSNDFTTERWRRAALKNAFALLGKQRFEQAAAFFLLGGALSDAVAVCLTRLHDLQLAIVIARLYEGQGEDGPAFQNLLKTHVLGIEASPPNDKADTSTVAAKKDPFLCSISHWILREYSEAMDILLLSFSEVSDEETSSGASPFKATAIFNLFFYLRSHPLLLRREYAKPAMTSGMSFNLMSAGKSTSEPKPVKKAISGVGSDPLTEKERQLMFSTVHAHMRSGQPLLALEVLSRLPPDGEEEEEEEATKEESSEFAAGGGSLFGGVEETSGAFDWSQPVSSSAGEIDWSQPVSSNAGEIDWSQPVGMSAGVGEIDWSQPEMPSQSGEMDWSQPVSQQLGSDSTVDGALASKGDTTGGRATPVEDPPSEKEKSTSRSGKSTAFSITQTTAHTLRWRAVLSLLLNQLRELSGDTMQSILADEFLDNHDEGEKEGSSSKGKKHTALNHMSTFRCRLWTLLVEELLTWQRVSGAEQRSGDIEDASILLLALNHNDAGEHIRDAAERWLVNNRHLLFALWQFLDLHVSATLPLQPVHVELGIMLQRVQLPSSSVVHTVALETYRTTFAVGEQTHSASHLLREIATQLPRAMPPLLLSASVVSCMTLWSPLSTLRHVAQQIFSIVFESQLLPSKVIVADERRHQLSHLVRILSATVVQSLVTVDHTLTARHHRSASPGRLSPFAYSIATEGILSAAQNQGHPAK